MCDCIEKIDEKLKEGGHCLNATMSFHGELQRPVIALLRLDKYTVETRRSQPSYMQASHCPWCGGEYAPAAIAKPSVIQTPKEITP